MEVREAWFRHVAGSAWLTLGPPRIVTPKRDPDGRWRLGDVETSDAELEAARPRGSDAAAKSFALIHQGWRVAPTRSKIVEMATRKYVEEAAT